MKTVTMYRPNQIHNVLSDFDRYFGSFFGDSILAPASRIFTDLPAVDIRETEQAYLLDMELPGYDEKNIDVRIDGSNLFISSKTEEEKKGGDGDSDRGEGAYVLRERRSASFSRSFKLPENADPEAANASFKNGILSLEIKKRPEARTRSIQINAA
ncbi:MAG: Hsp20/alpha crystallin family protein [Treponema sp.]|jgi:HSP20 family protein|nr:Hsp20/alpha crystallin family protein [Treponema sp.]